MFFCEKRARDLSRNEDAPSKARERKKARRKKLIKTTREIFVSHLFIQRRKRAFRSGEEKK